jgi:hypothetical protein
MPIPDSSFARHTNHTSEQRQLLRTNAVHTESTIVLSKLAALLSGATGLRRMRRSEHRAARFRDHDMPPEHPSRNAFIGLWSAKLRHTTEHERSMNATSRGHLVVASADVHLRICDTTG